MLLNHYNVNVLILLNTFNVTKSGHYFMLRSGKYEMSGTQQWACVHAYDVKYRENILCLSQLSKWCASPCEAMKYRDISRRGLSSRHFSAFECRCEGWRCCVHSTSKEKYIFLFVNQVFSSFCSTNRRTTT